MSALSGGMEVPPDGECRRHVDGVVHARVTVERSDDGTRVVWTTRPLVHSLVGGWSPRGDSGRPQTVCEGSAQPLAG